MENFPEIEYMLENFQLLSVEISLWKFISKLYNPYCHYLLNNAFLMM